MNPPEFFDLQRLRLRKPVASDAEAVFEYGSDPEVARYADWLVRTSMAGLAEALESRSRQWDSRTDFYWVITLRGEDRAIGGITCQMKGGSAEVGFLLNRRYWNQGLMTEAARAVVTWVLSISGVQKAWATCDAENAASARVLEKVGFQLEATLPEGIVRPNLSSDPRPALMYSMVKSGG